MTSLLFKLASNFIQLNDYGQVRLCKHDDPVLRKQSRELTVDEIKSENFQTLIRQMISVMRGNRGQGIAASQVGIDLQIIVFEFSQQDYDAAVQCYGHAETAKREMRTYPLTVLVNPKLRVTNFDKTLFEEGCLSLSKTGLVERFREVEVEGYDASGERKCLRFDGWMARIVQHEVHHLKGLLITDYFITKRKSRFW